MNALDKFRKSLTDRIVECEARSENCRGDLDIDDMLMYSARADELTAALKDFDTMCGHLLGKPLVDVRTYTIPGKGFCCEQCALSHNQFCGKTNTLATDEYFDDTRPANCPADGGGE